MIDFREEYPRPQMVRESFINLNGEWEFAFDDDCSGELVWYYHTFPQGLKINVPFSYESKMSGIGDRTMHPCVWYNKVFDAPKLAPNQRLLLHFEGCDYYTKVWVNGKKAGENTGCYHRFGFDITDFLLPSANKITVKAEDSYDDFQPRGKQSTRAENFACFYTRTTGIYKTVWMEVVNSSYIEHIKLLPNYDTNEVDITLDTELTFGECEVDIDITFNGEKILTKTDKVSKKESQFKISLGSNVAHWSPEAPNLYDISFTLKKGGEIYDYAESYFGVRKTECKDGKFLLNEEPVYMRMVLDQGYWPESVLTPPSFDSLKKDIDITFKCGYNGVRKHQKVEDERYYYLCDRLGLMLWSEIGNAMSYDRASGLYALDGWSKVVNQYLSHPCIVTWVPYNEDWGLYKVDKREDSQAFINNFYYHTKELDPTRPVICNDGWHHTISDIITMHEYTQNPEVMHSKFNENWDKLMDGTVGLNDDGTKVFADNYHHMGQPNMITEYGGIGMEGTEGWGYGEPVTDEASFIRRFEALTGAIYDTPHICGYCFTQLTDIEQEQNGLFYFDRTPKFSTDGYKKIKEINENK